MSRWIEWVTAWFSRGRGRAAKSKVRQVLQDTSDLLCDDDVNNAKSLLEHDEWGLALELICDQIYERGSSVTPEQLALIKAAAREMSFPDSTWEHLSASVNND